MGNKSWFFGIVLSLLLHGTIIFLVLFWSVGNSHTPESAGVIYGELVSLSEVGEPGAPKGGRSDIETKPTEPPAKEEVKREEAKPEPPPQQPREVQAEKKPKPPEEKPAEKRQEPKKQEEVKPKAPETLPTEPPKKEAIPLETVKEKKPEKKEAPAKIAEKPTPTPSQTSKPQEPRQPAKREGSDFEETRRNIIKDVQKQVVLRDIERSVSGREGQPTDGGSAVGGASGGRAGTPGGARGAGAALGALAGVYGDRLRTEIQSKWGVPANIPMDGSLSTKILFRIDEGGRVLDARVEKSSGNSAFDSFCLQAIYKASPLTPPPPELAQAARDDGLEVEFTNNPL